MTNRAIATAFERAAGVCECIGGGCPALTHRPGINRCFGALRSRDTSFFFTVARFADRTDPENIMVLCPTCAENPRKNAERVFDVTDAVAVAGEAAAEDHAS